MNRIMVAVVLWIVLSMGMAIGFAPQTATPRQDAGTEKETNGHVKRAVFTSAIIDREPTDQIDTLTTTANEVMFFTEIVGMEGKTITHRWVFDSESKADVSFDIGGPRWRVYSSKKLIPEWLGTWTVEVLDGEGNKLREVSFVYREE